MLGAHWRFASALLTQFVQLPAIRASASVFGACVGT
jgi:hypothetical protein